MGIFTNLYTENWLDQDIAQAEHTETALYILG